MLFIFFDYNLLHLFTLLGWIQKMLIGYARVSGNDQNLSLQMDALKNAGCKKIYTDKITGTKAERPGLNQVLDALRKGDILIVWRLDRLGRSLKHLIALIEDLNKKNIGFRTIQESMDTTTPGGKLIFHIFGALAEFERNLIRERTLHGIEAARARGKLGGRPKALDNKKRELVIKLYHDKSQSVKEICDIMKISKQTLYNYVNEK